MPISVFAMPFLDAAYGRREPDAAAAARPLNITFHAAQFRLSLAHYCWVLFAFDQSRSALYVK